MIYCKLIVIFLTVLVCGGCNEYRNKGEYSVLQVADLRARGTNISNVTFTAISGYQVVGFPSSGPQGDVWVLLNPCVSPYYKQIPQCQFTISREVFEKVKATHDASETVLAVLETHVDSNYPIQDSIATNSYRLNGILKTAK